MQQSVCFKYRPKETVNVIVPVQTGLNYTQVEREVGKKDVMKVLKKVYNWFPETSVYQHFLTLFGDRVGICPVSFLRSDLEELIILQDHCERYSCLPFGRALEDVPAWLMEAFSTITAAKNEWHRFEMDEMKGTGK